MLASTPPIPLAHPSPGRKISLALRTFALLVLLVGGDVLKAELPERMTASGAALAADIDRGPLREGSELVDQAGTFTFSDQRLIFSTSDGKRRLVTLENLCLERVARSLLENSAPATWIVSGSVSEYRNANYLSLRRAVRETPGQPNRTSPPPKVRTRSVAVARASGRPLLDTLHIGSMIEGNAEVGEDSGRRIPSAGSGAAPRP
jgi:hypothetical protein